MVEDKQDKGVKERVQDMTTMDFNIGKCPVAVYRGFTDFCKKETNNNYSLGLKMLLEAKKANIKEVILYEQFMLLREEVNEVKNELDALKGVDLKKKSPKSFGIKEEEGGKK